MALTSEKPVLVVMAAGMGSRYGGLKQIEPVTEAGDIIIDFTLYDAMLAGFEDVVFIIKREIEGDVRRILDAGAARHLRIHYAFQELDDLPAGYSVPEGRVKPWGTCHAILAARGLIGGNFAVVNADDYYGSSALRIVYDDLVGAKDGAQYDFSLVGYRLANTLTENGYVARGVAQLGAGGVLAGVDERLKIGWKDGRVAYEEGGAWVEVSPDSTVSMNLWGFTPSLLREMEDGFPAFLDQALAADPLKGEYLLPRKVDELIKAGRARVRVLTTDDRWYGITYPEDKETVSAAMQAMKDRGEYPEQLW
ncbi:MAG: nucleotidyltransferase [Clostridiales Family XIII bacterium]|jgi:dTDP-glucose pyrophosphorylase|nr:nucleotidyltransferase [Clostridiales Family XIII bacterium]